MPALDIAHPRDFSRDEEYLDTCRRSPLTWLANEFWINTPHTHDGIRRKVLIDLNVEQVRFLKDVERQLRETGRVRTIILKSRRLGFTTIIVGLSVWAAKFIALTSVEGVTHHAKLNPTINRMLSLAIQSARTGARAQKVDGAWNFDNGSIIAPYYTQGGDENKARGGDPTFLHLLELPSWESSRKETSAADVAQGLFAALIDAPNTFLFMESTAGAVGDFFYKRWEAAVSGKDTTTTPLFFSWTENKRHGVPCPDPTRIRDEVTRYQALLEACELKDEAEQMAHASALRLDGPELALVRDHRLTMDQLRWRRQILHGPACNSEVERFDREYPVSPEHAFSATGLNVFKTQQIQAALKRLEKSAPEKCRCIIEPEGTGFAFKSAFFIGGGWEVYQAPSPGRTYILAVDVADGGTNETANYSCIQVLDRAALVQVAEFYGKTPPEVLATQVAWCAAIYNGAHVVVESNRSGVLVIHHLQTEHQGLDLYRRYLDPNEVARRGQEPESRIGWMTTEQSRNFAIGEFERLFRTGQIALNSKRLLAEMTTFIRAKNSGRKEAQRGFFDDAILAISIAVAVHATTPSTLPAVTSLEVDYGDTESAVEWSPDTGEFVVRPLRDIERWTKDMEEAA